MRRSFKAINLGLITAIFGAVVYFFAFGYELEENFGLDMLFKVRGKVAMPEDTVIVAINKMSSDYFHLENDPSKWPRHYHAKLIDTLNSHGAKVIAFDVFFKEARDVNEDESLATSIKNAGNVILFSQLKRQILSQQGRSPEFQDLKNAINIEQLVHPVENIAEAAAVLAPFALLKYPQKITQFWTFRVPAGEIPNLPVMALQLAALDDYQMLYQLLQQVVPQQVKYLPVNLKEILRKQQLTETVTEVRRLFKENPGLSAIIKKRLENTHLNKEKKASLLSLVNMYQGPNQYYLNFYGPPRSIKTYPIHEVITSKDKTKFDFKDKVVFVGFSEYLQPEQKDNFYTVFSQENGLDISGVEIAATAFSNLKNNETIKTLTPVFYISLIMIYGFLVAFVSRYFHTLPSVFFAISIMAAYVFISYLTFSENNIWLPWAVPILVQSPFAIFIALLCHYSDTRREREQIRKAFGFYLPTNVVNKIAQNAGHIEANQQQMYGICLATDAAHYTRMAEQMRPDELSQLVNNYYEHLFGPVRHHGGIISDVVGDAMLAIWSSPQSNVELRTQACHAALEIDRVMNQLNSHNREPYLLPTRIGLHAGELMLGNVGAMDHFEYRAVGDIVNTSNRIENLNKQLGSSVIASENVLEGVTGIMKRSLGKFRLAGKQQALELYELFCKENDPQCDKNHIQILERCEMLSLGIKAFQAQDWQTAKAQFSELKSKYSNDKAADFYLQYCDLLHERTLPHEWAGIIELSEK